MTKIYCDQCGEMILETTRNNKIINLGNSQVNVMTAWKVSIKAEMEPGFYTCQPCLDDVMERAFRLFLETRSTKRG